MDGCGEGFWLGVFEEVSYCSCGDGSEDVGVGAVVGDDEDLGCGVEGSEVLGGGDSSGLLGVLWGVAESEVHEYDVDCAWVERAVVNGCLWGGYCSNDFDGCRVRLGLMG